MSEEALLRPTRPPQGGPMLLAKGRISASRDILRRRAPHTESDNASWKGMRGWVSHAASRRTVSSTSLSWNGFGRVAAASNSAANADMTTTGTWAKVGSRT